MRISSPGVSADDRYRTLPESSLVDAILLGGYACGRENRQALDAVAEGLDRWTAMGLGVRRGEDGQRLFDPVEVLNFLKSAALDGRDPFWFDTYVRTTQRLSEALAADADQIFTAQFKRTFDLRWAQPGKTLRLRAPTPLSSAHGLLEIEPFLEGAQDARLSQAEGRLEARLVADAPTVTLGAHLRFIPAAEGRTQKGPMEDPAYLKPKEGLVVVTDRVDALGKSLAGPDARPEDAVRAFWNYIMDELVFGAVHYDQVDADAPGDWVLESGWYDCQLASALFIALCRARGLPARQVAGYIMFPACPSMHYWAEVWFEDRGWVPFDFMSFDISGGGRSMEWRDRFYGRLEPRIVTQRLPHEFTGALGAPLPEAWRIVHTPEAKGVRIDFTGIDGTPVYSDFLSISVLGARVGLGAAQGT